MKKKEIIKSPTLDQLKETLNRIGWDMRHCGCNYYRIVNSKGKDTGFEILKDSDELKNGDIFGSDYSGTFVIKLSAIRLSYFTKKGGNPFVSISLLGLSSNKFFISFYNHDS
jgi:hypothetical protein